MIIDEETKLRFNSKMKIYKIKDSMREDLNQLLSI